MDAARENNRKNITGGDKREYAWSLRDKSDDSPKGRSGEREAFD